MRKFLIWILALLMALTPVCAGAETLEAQAQAWAQEICDALLAGDYASVVDAFDENMAAQVSAEALEQGFQSVLPLMGQYQGRGAISQETQGDYNVLRVEERFANSNLEIQLALDDEGRIAGLQMRPVAAEAADETQDGPWTEVELTVAADPAYPLGATLCLPEGADAALPPVVLLVQGSGSSDRDETIFQNRPFRDLAHGLAELGVASLRYDKRTFVYPEVEGESGTDIDLRGEMLEDVNACLDLLRADARVDNGRIFVLGHSLGGMMVPAIAAENPDLAGAISMAGSLRPLWEIVYDQNQEIIQAACACELSDAGCAALDAQVEQLEADMAVLRGDFSDLSDDALVLGISARYWKSLRDYGGMNFLEKIDLPLLILQGGADFQVSPEKDFPLWQEALVGRENAQFHLYPELNHLMMPTTGQRNTTDYVQPSHVAQEVIADIAAFVCEN